MKQQAQNDQFFFNHHKKAKTGAFSSDYIKTKQAK